MARARPKTKPPSRPRRRPAAIPGDTGERLLKIGAAAKLIGVEPYVLRFWETQFPFLRPKHSRSRHRSYGPTDIETLKSIKRLLHIEGYTIIGARKYIREKGLDHMRGAAAYQESSPASSPTRARRPEPGEPDMATNGHMQRTLCEIREELRALHKLLTSIGS